MYNKSLEERIEKLEYKKNEEKFKFVELKKKGLAKKIDVATKAMKLLQKLLSKFKARH